MADDHLAQKPVSPPQGEYMHLGRKAFWIFALGESGIGIAGIFLGIFLFVLSATPAGAQIEGAIHIGLGFIAGMAILLALLFVAAAIFVSWLWYITYQFRLGENAFEIKRGILAKAEIAVPYRQIQDVDVDQTFFYRMIGLADVRIITAGAVQRGEGGETEEVLPSLEKDAAEALREELLRRTNVQEVMEVDSKKTEQSSG